MTQASITSMQAERAAHTPGPWTVIKGDDHDFSVSHDGDCDGLFEGVVASGFKVIGNPEMDEFAAVVVDMNHMNTWDDELLDANARLIIAAPDLLAALDALRDQMIGVDRWWGELSTAIEAADAAIAKARGEA